MASESLSFAPLLREEGGVFVLTLTSPGVLVGGGLLVPNKLLPLVVSGPSEGRKSLEMKEDYFIVKDTTVS